MSISCQHCSGHQPLDWRAGDVCVHCGKAVRSDQRCYWCVTWTPSGGFCRSCGAAVVERRLFGAARMLKDGGVDRFSIPKMLKEMDADYLENLDRIYQRQVSVIARHVDDTAFLEGFLFEKHWSADVEDELIRQLPWPPEMLERMSVFPARPESPLQRARAIAETSPVPLARRLATVVRLKLDDWSCFHDVHSMIGDKTLGDEPLLAASSWRVFYGGVEVDRRAFNREARLALRDCSFQTASAVRLAFLGEEIEIPYDAIGSADPDIQVPVAILRKDVDRLAAALQGDPITQIAAGVALIHLDQLGLLAGVLRDAPDAVKSELLWRMSGSKTGSPKLRAVLLHLVETHPETQIRVRAAHVLCRAAADEDALRIARAANGDTRVLQSLLLSESFHSTKVEEVLCWMIGNGGFRMAQYGLSTVAEKGRVPDSFVPRRFSEADDETKIEMCGFAEIQLIHRGDEELHRFLMRVAFGPHPADLRHTAWWSLRRWYLRSDPRGANPAGLEEEPCRRFFGSYGDFALRLAKILEDPKIHEEASVAEFLERMLGDADLQTMSGDSRATWRLAEAVAKMMRDRERGRFTLRTSGAKFFAILGKHEKWREKAIAALGEFSGTDIDYHCSQAIDQIRARSNQ